MNLQDLIADIEARIPFINNITVTTSTSTGSLHPSLKIGLAAVLDCIGFHHSKRLVLLLPKREDSAIWLAFLTNLWLMKTHFDLEFQTPKLSKGSKIRLNDCIVEYLREELAPDRRTWLLWVQCRDGSYAFKLDREYSIVPFQTDKPLSKLKNVAAAYATANEKYYTLDHILDIKACGNLQLFYKTITVVSSKCKFQNFVETYEINNAPLNSLINWGKINKEGRPVNLTHDSFGGVFPSCMVSSNMFRLSSFLEQNTSKSALQGILIDGVNFCEGGLQIIDDYICSRDIPTVVIADYSELRGLKYLVDRGFKILHLDRFMMPVPLSPSPVPVTPFNRYDRIFRNSQCLEVKHVVVQDATAELLFDSMFALERIISDQVVKDCWLSLLYITLELSKKLHPITCVYAEKIQVRISSVKSQIARYSMWMQDELRAQFEECISVLGAFVTSLQRTDSPKFVAIKETLDRHRNKTTAFLVSDEAEGYAAAVFWNDVFATSEGEKSYPAAKNRKAAMQFVPISNLHETESEFDLIAISGWPGRERFSSILSEFAAPSVSLFIYKAEESWFRAANAEWKRGVRISSDRSVLKSAFKIMEALAPEEPATSCESLPANEPDIYLTIRKHQLSRYIANPSESEVINARFVKFSGGKFSFMSQTHMHYVVSDLIRHQSSPEIPKKKTEELRTGDYILVMDSDSNLIRDIVDSWLEREGKSSLRETASLWRQSLMRKYDRLGRGLNDLSSALARAGCARHQTTLRKWLFDDDVIGPQDYDRDLPCIAEATGDAFLMSKIPEISAAIATLRGLHIQAACIVRERCLNKLTSILGNSSIDGTETMTFDVESIKATILRIEEIGRDLLAVNPSEVNRILDVENL